MFQVLSCLKLLAGNGESRVNWPGDNYISQLFKVRETQEINWGEDRLVNAPKQNFPMIYCATSSSIMCEHNLNPLV